MKRKRIWRLFALIVAALVLLPFVYSRLVSPWHRIAVFSSDSVQTALEPTQFRVACYNIAHGRGLAKSNFNGESAERRLQRLDEIADLLIDIDADIVVLNEVDFESSWSHSVNQAEYLATKAGYPFRVEQRNYDLRVLGWKWRFGNAVLSRFPVQNVRLLNLPDHATWEAIVAGKKSGVQAEVLIGKTPIRIAGVHLCHRSEGVRVASARQLIRSSRSATLPVIIAGDLNSSPPDTPRSKISPYNENAMSVFDESLLFQRSPALHFRKQDLTFPADAPNRIIDWILTSATVSRRNQTVVDSQLSDHRPVFVDLALTP